MAIVFCEDIKRMLTVRVEKGRMGGYSKQHVSPHSLKKLASIIAEHLSVRQLILNQYLTQHMYVCECVSVSHIRNAIYSARCTSSYAGHTLGQVPVLHDTRNKRALTTNLAHLYLCSNRMNNDNRIRPHPLHTFMGDRDVTTP